MKTIALTIPTGVGAQIGGYAGDCGKIAREFSKHFRLIVNPNVVNAGVLSAINSNMLYVEGAALDEFFCGNINLAPCEKPNKIGVIFDRAIPDNILNIHINTINAAKTVWGMDICGYELTQEDAGVNFSICESTGISSGGLDNPETLYDAAQKLILKGASSLAVVCYFDDDADDEYYASGCGVDPIGGVEAVISHCLTKKFMLPCAHSPAFSSLDIGFEVVNEKVSSEYISSTYLPCVLQGLEYAPQLTQNGGIKNTDIECLIVPSGCMGSKAVLGAIQNNIKVYGIKNPCSIDVCCKKLQTGDILEFNSYQECIEYLKEKNNV